MAEGSAGADGYIPWIESPGRMPNATSAPDVQPRDQKSAHPACGLVALRDRQIRSPEDYGIELPHWLRECIDQYPPGNRS